MDRKPNRNNQEYIKYFDQRHFMIQLTKIRKDVGIGQDKLSETLEFTPRCIHLLESGFNLPTIEHACRLADYFKVGVEYFIKLL